MQHRIGLAVVCLHISAALYVLVGALVGLLFLARDDADMPRSLGVVLCALCLALVAGIEVVAYGLGQRKFWAWVAGLCLFGIYVPSLFFPLGALGLWGLLDAGSRAEFGLGGPASRA